MSSERNLPGPSPAEYAARRQRVLAALERSVMILPAGGLTTYASDCDNRYRPDGNFRYLTGFPEPGAVLVLRPDAAYPATMFVPARDPQQEVWTGRRHGPEGATRVHGVDAAFPLELMAEKLPALLDGCEALYYSPWRDAELDALLSRTLKTLRQRERFGRRAPHTIIEPGELLSELRLVKTAEEIALLQRACAISAEGHRAAMRVARPGVGEWQIQAEIERVFRQHGAAGPGYGTIVGSGANGCILHYVENDAAMSDGQLVLVDAGAEYGGYNGDITRTFPVSGKFTPAQRSLYEIVSDALEQGLAAAKPGATIDAIHALTLKRLSQGLIDLGILQSSLDETLERELYLPYYMHRTSHWLGIDVHDAGRYRQQGVSRPLEAGMVLTIEPGLYLQPGDQTVPVELRGQAVRLEDNVVITPDGALNLTRSVPIGADEICALVGH
ncbi:MAG: aminopeptidase P N-terminal domain-containing protein [Acidobacteriota bacterium]